MLAPACPELAALLIAVRDEPFWQWYDVTRLVLADWLEERGDARCTQVRALRVCARWQPDLEFQQGQGRVEYKQLSVRSTEWIDFAIVNLADSPLYKHRIARGETLRFPTGEGVFAPIVFRINGHHRVDWTVTIDLSYKFKDSPNIEMFTSKEIHAASAIQQSKEAILALFRHVLTPFRCGLVELIQE